ncbi:LPS export ABC transporter permease LptF [Faucicola atlantae]|uniref:LPS export ABC transporter permease LptF n=1 Tax=Faucicola atlantae TaxID=34059 RepID=UPI0009F71164|nr:LPS export ABC transporter permease LptF [Moraxella atlantae]
MILRRYITQQVATNTLVVLGFLLVLMLSGRLIRYFGMAAQGRLDIGLLFTIIGYNLPTFVELILPLAFFVALMLVLGRMYIDQEMSVLFASGIDRGRVLALLLPLVSALFVLEAGVSIWAKPWGVRHSEQVWHKQSLASALDLIRPQTFISSGDYHLYVEAFDRDKRELRGLYVLNTRDDGRTDVITAERALQVPTREDDPMTLLDLYAGKRYTLSADSARYNQASFARYRISLQKPNIDKVTPQNVESQTIGKLWRARTESAAQAELGYRVSLPWLMLIAALLAMPLAQVNPRQGRWLRLLPAVLIFASCAIAIISLKTAVSKQKVSVWAYAWLLAALLLATLYLNAQSTLATRLRARRRVRRNHHLDNQGGA